MKKMKTATIAAVLTVLLAFTACDIRREKDSTMVQERNRTVIEGSDKSITVIDNQTAEVEPPSVSVAKIEQYKGMEITDWLDEQTVVLSKENQELEKMSLAENAEYFPRSLYLYNLDAREYRTLKAQKNMFLGGAVLSPDKTHLLYYEYSIGDTVYYLMSMEGQEQSPVSEEGLGIAYTAGWADAQTVIGVSYAGGAYTADTTRKITQIAELQEEQLYTVRKIQDIIYYITIDGPTFQLYLLNMKTGEKKNLEVENADGIVPSPDGTKILISQWTGATKKLHLADAEGNILKTLAEGTDVNGVSWSPDQRMIVYRLESVTNGTVSSGLHLYDILTDESMQIAVDIGNAETSWSPSGKKIAVTESDGRNYNSNIIYLK